MRCMPCTSKPAGALVSSRCRWNLRASWSRNGTARSQRQRCIREPTLSADLALAQKQVHLISLLSRVFLPDKRIQAVMNDAPVNVPRGPGSVGFDESTWVGLGLVGLWAA